MGRLEFCADEHVPDAYVTALRSNGFTVVRAVDERGERTIDETLLAWCGTQGLALLTNDRDFVRLADSMEHAGLLVYTAQDLTPSEVSRAVRRIDRQFTSAELSDTLMWVDNWI